MLRNLRHRLRALFRPGALERELDDELHFHLQRAIERHRRAGLALDDATRRARLELGGLEQVKEACRDERGISTLERARQDMRFAVGALRKSRAFAAVAVAVLALGVGATATAFAILDGVLLKPLPYPGADRLVQLGTSFGSVSVSAMSTPDLEDVAARATTLAAAGMTRTRMIDVTGDGPPARLSAAVVSAGFFHALGVAPALGRAFDAASDRRGADRLVVLSHGVWRRRFAGDPSAIGRTLAIDGAAHTIVGVMPASFRGPDALAQTAADVWIPLGTVRPPRDDPEDAAWGAIARVNDGFTLEEAAAELDAIGRDVAGGSRRRFWLAPLLDRTVGGTGLELWLLFGAVGALFVIACANIAGLFLVRATERSREMAIRAAMGATLGRLVRQLLAESALVSVAGGTLGLALATIGVGGFRRLAPADLPRLHDVVVDVRVVAFAMSITTLMALAIGLAPAMHTARRGLGGVLRQSSASQSAARAHARGRGLLVVVQMTLALVLLVGAALLVNSFVRLTRVDPGFDARDVVWLDVTLPARYADGRARLAFLETLLPVVRGLPGVLGAGAIGGRPLDGGNAMATMHPSEHLPAEAEEVRRFPFHVVTPGYFAAMGIPLLDGRDVRDDDRTGAPRTAVISRSLAARFWPAERAVGKRFWVGRVAAGAPLVEVAGVVEDVRHFGLAQAPEPIVYLPLAQAPVPRGRFAIVMRHDGSSEDALAHLRNAVWRLDAALPLDRGGTMADAVLESLGEPRARTLALALFASIAAAVAGVGLYATLAWVVRARRREIGIRIALGAAPGAVRTLVVRRALALTLAGLTLGVLAATWTSQWLASMVFGITTRDVPTFLAAAGALAAVAAIACWIPARRAAAIDPVETLRVE